MLVVVFSGALRFVALRVLRSQSQVEKIVSTKLMFTREICLDLLGALIRKAFKRGIFSASPGAMPSFEASLSPRCFLFCVYFEPFFAIHLIRKLVGAGKKDELCTHDT